jgi:undecaprenyl-diphosphatase
MVMTAVLAVVVAKLPVTEHIDAAVHDALFPRALIAPFGSSVLADTARDVSALGGVVMLVAVSAVAILYALLRRDRRAALFLAVVIGGATILSLLLKMVFMRDRPELVSPLILQTTYSFPSGHALLSAAIYPAIALLWKKIESADGVARFFFALALMTSLAVAISRIVLGAHYISDVVVGLTIGYCWTGVCAHFLLPGKSDRSAKSIR